MSGRMTTTFPNTLFWPNAILRLPNLCFDDFLFRDKFWIIALFSYRLTVHSPSCGRFFNAILDAIANLVKRFRHFHVHCSLNSRHLADVSKLSTGEN
jgi:hypothetical protein